MAFETANTSQRKNLAGLMDSAYLLRSPRNARRLLTALRRAERGHGRPSSVEKLRREMRLGARR